MFVHEEYIDNKLLYTVMSSSSQLYVVLQGSRKQYLYALLRAHRIWKSSFVWRDCIQYDVNQKLDNAVERKKKRELLHAEEEAGSSFSFKKLMIASKHLGKSIINSKEETHEEDLAEC
jgi:hypothetical protein